MNEQTMPLAPASRNMDFLAGAGGALTMNSVEIADLVEKRHDHVMRDIRAMIEGLEIEAPNFGGSYLGENGRALPCFNLPKDLTLTLVAGYNVKLRKRIIDRWLELEAKAQPAPLDYSNPQVLLGVLDHLQSKVREQNEVIEIQSSKVKQLARLEAAKGSMCLSDAAKTLGVRRDDLIARLAAERWIFKRAGNKNWLAYDTKRQTGLMEHDDHIYFDSEQRERISTRCLVTAKGLVKLAEILERRLH